MLTFLTPRSFALGSLITALTYGLSLDATAANWPNWRGPTHDNIAPETTAPMQWDKTKNIRWRVPLPEPGNSSPIVWGDKVFVTQAIEANGDRSILCYHRRDGKLLWNHSTRYAGKERKHETNTHCSSSPVTDGERVIAHFGSAGVFCYDLNGKVLWQADLGPQDHNWGQGSSPVIHGDLCIVYHGPGTPSTLIALDKKTGKKVWENAVPEVQPQERFDGFAGKSDGMLGSFATPIISPSKSGSDEVIMPVANQLRAWDVKTGKPKWFSTGMNPLVYSSPTLGEGFIVAMGGFFGSTITIRPNHQGDATAQRAWYEQRAKKHRIGSPVIFKGNVFIANTDGTAECIDLASGKSLWLERLKATGANGETWSSMVLIGDKLYITNRSGDTFILKAAPTFEQVAVNSVGELSNSTLAVSNGELFLRTHAALYCIGSVQKVASLSTR